jgi:hypothetical protein
VAEFIHRAGLGFHVLGQSIEDIRSHETFVIFRMPVGSGRISWRTGGSVQVRCNSVTGSVTFGWK